MLGLVLSLRTNALKYVAAYRICIANSGALGSPMYFSITVTIIKHNEAGLYQVLCSFPDGNLAR